VVIKEILKEQSLKAFFPYSKEKQEPAPREQEERMEA
jgi:hypothetical protein